MAPSTDDGSPSCCPVRLVEIPDSYTLIPEDQPTELARLLREFVREPTTASG